MLNRLRYGPARPAAGRFRWSRIAVALAFVVLLAAGLRPVSLSGGGSGDDDPPSGETAVEAGAPDRAILPVSGIEGMLPRAAAWRSLRAKAERGLAGADGPPPDAPRLVPAEASPNGSGTTPVRASTEHRAFHLRLVGTPRTPTGPPFPPA